MLPLLTLMLASRLAAQVLTPNAPLPPGWIPATDSTGQCRVVVPPDWTMRQGGASAPDGTVSVSIRLVAAASWAAAKAAFEKDFPPDKMVQDDAKALIYSFKPQGPESGRIGWSVEIASTPICAAAFVYTANTDDGPLKRIASSLAPAK